MTKAKDWTEEEPFAISREQAAHRLGLGLRTLDRLLASGELKARKFRRRVLVPIPEIKRYLMALAERVVAEEVAAATAREKAVRDAARAREKAEYEAAGVEREEAKARARAKQVEDVRNGFEGGARAPQPAAAKGRGPRTRQ
jgi:excisionase family DNA binding protein